MKNKLSLLILGILLISFTSAFCSDGEAGSIAISSIEDRLDDNTVAWQWKNGDDIEIRVTATSTYETKKNMTSELLVLEKDGSQAYVIEGTSHPKEKGLLEDERRFDFSIELKDDINYDVYDLFIKVYEDNNESEVCRENSVGIRINSFDDYPSDANLSVGPINDRNDFDWLVGEKQRLSFNITNSHQDEEDYTATLIIYDGSETEIDIDTEDELTYDLTMTNGTYIITFEFEVGVKVNPGTYGYYFKVVSDDGDRAIEYRGSDGTLGSKRSLRPNYYFINIRDVLGVKVTNVIGETNLTSGDTEKYMVTITNTGEDEPRVLVHGWYKESLGTIVVLDLGSGETRIIPLEITIPETVGNLELIFLADYGYEENRTRFIERTSNYGHDITVKVMVSEKPIVIPIIKEEHPDTFVPAPVEPEEQKIGWGFPLLALLAIASIATVKIRRSRKNIPKVKIDNPYY